MYIDFDSLTNERLAELLDDGLREMADRLKLSEKELRAKLYWNRNSVLDQAAQYKQRIRLQLNLHGFK